MDELKHYGTPRHSGRYPWGSGENPYQRTGRNFISRDKELREQGLSEKERAEYFGMSIRELRSAKTLARAQVRQEDYTEAYRLRQKGMSPTEIGKRMNKNESSVRALLDEGAQQRSRVTHNTAEALKKSLSDRGGYIDISKGSEIYLNVSPDKLRAAVKELTDQGYEIHYIQVEQLFGQGKTTIKVLTPPNTKTSDIYDNIEEVRYPMEYHITDTGEIQGLRDIQNISSNRVSVRYAEQGGSDKDGVIELRRGVSDLDLGNSKYAQVRIGVDGTHYLKGMAVYSDDMPDGVDIIFNTNKHEGTSKMDTFKKMKDPTDTKNPFGASISRQNGALNIVNEEGDWFEWSKNLSSQMLSKQHPSLAKRQLKLAGDISEAEFKDILRITNPPLRRYLLNKFADECDSDAVHLKAASLPRQSSKVILPVPSLKNNEIYAPSYRDGEEVALVRYPHGGTFEIPVLKVNNKNRDAKAVMENAQDAVGINPHVAARLSGADFDGDTVIVIPTATARIRSTSPLKGLENFDPKEAYPERKGMRYLTEQGKQNEMGRVSNLITDMTLQGASEEEICRAVRHSMVVIDAEKHKLDYQQSYIDNGIRELKIKYQGVASNGMPRGASTLISKASSETRVPARTEYRYRSPQMTDEQKRDWDEGKTVYKYSNETYIDKKGKEKQRTVTSTKMRETDDAYSLSSGTVMENIYADYANRMKAMANEARKEARNTARSETSSSARKLYSEEVASLNNKLKEARRNAPKERKAQILANSTVNTITTANPELKDKAHKDELKKIKNRALSEARSVTGAKKNSITITKKEWDAIQAGAISDSRLSEIFLNTDLDILREWSSPRNNRGMSQAKLSRAKSMHNAGYSWADIADALGVSTSTLQRALE